MSLESFIDRNRENRPGKIYVDSCCLDCDLCRDTAPTIFKRQNHEGYSYVAKQPETEEEISQVLECLEGCCTEAIHDDGDEFDWNLELPLPSRSKEIPRSTCSCKHHNREQQVSTTSISGILLKMVSQWFSRK